MGDIIGIVIAVIIVFGAAYLVVRWRLKIAKKRIKEGWEHCAILIDEFESLYDEWLKSKSSELKDQIEKKWHLIKNNILNRGLTDENGTGSLELDKIIFEIKTKYNEVKDS